MGIDPAPPGPAWEDDDLEEDAPAHASREAERHRMWLIVLFILAAMALAVVLAYFYAMPSAD